MTIQHITIYHCQECGRIIFQPRGALTPACCGTTMVCAVSDVARETSEAAASTVIKRPPVNGLSGTLDVTNYVVEAVRREHSTI